MTARLRSPNRAKNGPPAFHHPPGGRSTFWAVAYRKVDLDAVHARLLAGESLAAIAADIGMTHTALHKRYTRAKYPKIRTLRVTHPVGLPPELIERAERGADGIKNWRHDERGEIAADRIIAVLGLIARGAPAHKARMIESGDYVKGRREPPKDLQGPGDTGAR